MSTVTASVAEPSSVAGPPPGRRGPRWRRGLLVAAVLLAVFVVGATLVKIPFYALAPGSAVEVDGIVRVGDNSVPPSEGSISLLTVKLTRVSLVDAVRGWIDPEVDILEKRRILPPEVDPGKLEELNLAEMEVSKQQALAVAFEELGYDAVSGQGAEVVEVTAGTPAGMALSPGAVIVAIDDVPVTSHYDVVEVLGDHRPGASVRVGVDPPGPERRRDVVLTLDAAPGQPARAFLGATLSTLEPRFDFPVPVEIAVGGIGGPSAGLAFALEVLDVLTEGNLTGGHQVGATGTIALDGSVGRVGGVAQKTAVARREGVDLLLVPRPELEEARRLAGGDLAVEAVDNLSQALRVLADHGGDPLSPHP